MISTEPAPKISVCIPVYNCEKYIAAAIDSVLSQTFHDYELIILDNCSTDGTLGVIRRYSDKRIRVIVNETNMGAAGNWNKALDEARGEYIKILCADDLLYPECLELQLALLEAPENRDAVMACCGRDVIVDSGSRVMTRRFSGARGKIAGGDAIRRNVRAGTNLIGEPTAVLFRAGAVPLAGSFRADMRYVIDLDFWCRLLLHGDLCVVHRTLCVFRVSSDSWSCQVGNSQNTDFSWLAGELRRDMRFGVTGTDEVLGKSRALLNKHLRRLFYLLVLRRK